MKVKDFRKLLLESLFNPKNPGPMKIILDQNNPSYFEVRARELIQDAEQSLGFSPNEHNLALYNDKMIKAISLLTMARYLRNENNTTRSEKKKT